MNDLYLVAICLSFISVIISIYKWVIPTIKESMKQKKLRVGYTNEQKYEYYQQRARNPKLSFTQRQFALEKLKKYRELL